MYMESSVYLASLEMPYVQNALCRLCMIMSLIMFSVLYDLLYRIPCFIQGAPGEPGAVGPVGAVVSNSSSTVLYLNHATRTLLSHGFNPGPIVRVVECV